MKPNQSDRDREQLISMATDAFRLCVGLPLRTLTVDEVVRFIRRRAADDLSAAPHLATDGKSLLNRLDEIEIPKTPGCPDALVRDWLTHVEPAIARFRAALASPPPDRSTP